MSTLGFQLSRRNDKKRRSPPEDHSYDGDFFLWTIAQAGALKDRRWDALDLENLVDEVESLGKSEKREIESRLAVIVLHLLKWRFQAPKRSSNWRGTLFEQRKRVQRSLNDSPSLRSYPAEILAEEYEVARLKAAGETGLPEETFPQTCPFTIDQILDESFYPEVD